MQGMAMGAVQMLTQGFSNCINLQDRNSAPVKRHGLPNRLQTSSYGARKVLSTISNRKSIIKIVKQDCVEKRPNRTSSYFVPKFKCPIPARSILANDPIVLHLIAKLLEPRDCSWVPSKDAKGRDFLH